MSHYPTTDFHITRTGTFLLRSDPDPNKTVAQISSAETRIYKIGTYPSTLDQTNDGVVMETELQVPGNTRPGIYDWQQWITVNGQSFPVAGGELQVDREIVSD